MLDEQNKTFPADITAARKAIRVALGEDDE